MAGPVEVLGAVRVHAQVGLGDLLLEQGGLRRGDGLGDHVHRLGRGLLGCRLLRGCGHLERRRVLRDRWLGRLPLVGLPVVRLPVLGGSPTCGVRGQAADGKRCVLPGVVRFLRPAEVDRVGRGFRERRGDRSGLGRSGCGSGTGIDASSGIRLGLGTGRVRVVCLEQTRGAALLLVVRIAVQPHPGEQAAYPLPRLGDGAGRRCCVGARVGGVGNRVGHDLDGSHVGAQVVAAVRIRDLVRVLARDLVCVLADAGDPVRELRSTLGADVGVEVLEGPDRGRVRVVRAGSAASVGSSSWSSSRSSAGFAGSAGGCGGVVVPPSRTSSHGLRSDRSSTSSAVRARPNDAQPCACSSAAWRAVRTEVSGSAGVGSGAGSGSGAGLGDGHGLGERPRRRAPARRALPPARPRPG